MAWTESALFYHIYPLGLCGAPPGNDLEGEVVPRLEKIYSWLDHLEWLGVNAVILGPVFEALSHGYDTVDYLQVDRRLGTQDTLRSLLEELQRRGIRIALDAVLNHVSRRFWAFEDVCHNLEQSPYCSWFSGLRMDPAGYPDPFVYDGWDGHRELVKLNTGNPEVRSYLLSIVDSWLDTYPIDGFRLDAADVLDLGFQRELADFCHGRHKDFWLMGEVVFGDYNDWVNSQTLESATNYQLYKALHSSLNDRNCFELAHALEREYGTEGLYSGLSLYNFVDNHDVDRIGSILQSPAHLPLVYGLLFSIPGMPSVYYGSEWGYRGKKLPQSDQQLRPDLDLDTCINGAPVPDLPGWIRRLADVRGAHGALRDGSYQTLLVRPEQIVFSRGVDQIILVALNASDQSTMVEFPWDVGDGMLDPLLDSGIVTPVNHGAVKLDLQPNSFELFSFSSEG